MTELLIAVPFGLAMAYAILGGVAFGLPLAGFIQTKAARSAGAHLFSPAWESTNVLLAAAVLSAALLIPAILPVMVVLLHPLWLLIVCLLVARVVLLLVHYHPPAHNLGVLRWTLAVVSLALPAVLIQNVTILITGDSNLLDHLALTGSLGLLAVILTIALWGGFYYQPGKATREVARTSFWFGLLLAAVTLPLALMMDPGVPNSFTLSQCWPLAVGAVAAVLCLMKPVRWRYFAASSLLATGVGSTLLLLLLPFLTQPATELNGMFAAPMIRVVLGAALVVLTVAGVGLLMLRRLVRP